MATICTADALRKDTTWATLTGGQDTSS
jgi:hypothetical protein